MFLKLPWWLPGTFMIFFGVMIAIFPELLALLVAAAFISAGLGMLFFGRSVRAIKRQNIANYRYYYRDDNPYF